jgi:hypothetical protein
VQDASAKFVVVAMEGQLELTDLVHAQRLAPSDATRDLPIHAPSFSPS